MSRASDDTREQAMADAAHRAAAHDELASVTGDLPRHRAVWRAVLDRLAPIDVTPPALRPPDMHVGDRRVIGRAPTCDYAIDDGTVSMRHAELVREDDGWLIRDLGSRNGTRVNGWLVKEQRLRAGDTLTLGLTTFRFQP